MSYDLFISHASEDKTSIARPLAEELRRRGWVVWFDEFELTLGDSLRRKIDRGLAEARFGIVILSPAFFAKAWPQRELDGLTAREIAGSQKVILPIWHDVDHEFVARYSPPLADKLAVPSAAGVPQIVDRIAQALGTPAGLSATRLPSPVIPPRTGGRAGFVRRGIGDLRRLIGRPLPRGRWRLIAAISLVIAILAGWSLVASDIWSGEPDARRRVETAAPQIIVPTLEAPADAVLSLRMRGTNRTYKPRWGRTVRADATDVLEFETTIDNRSRDAVKDVLLVLSCTVFCTGSGSDPLTLRTSIITGRGATLGTSNPVRIEAQSGGMQRFVFGDQRGDRFLSEVFDTGIGSSSDIVEWRGRAKLRTSTATLLKVFRIGALQPNSRRRLRFKAWWDVGTAGQLAAGPSKLRVGAGEWQPGLAASPGEIVTVGTLLDNAAYSHPWTAHVRVRFRPHRSKGTVDIITNAYLPKGHDQGGPQPTGSVTLQSAGAGPIDLEIVPGTTELWGHCRPLVCSKRSKDPDKIKLPDGLTGAGIEVGPLGGFVPRDTQHGTQFTRYLVFKVKVKSLAA